MYYAILSIQFSKWKMSPRLHKMIQNSQVHPDDLLSKEVSRLLDSESLISSESVAISFGNRKFDESLLLLDSGAGTDLVFRRGAREASPEYDELQRQIEALRYAEES